MAKKGTSGGGVNFLTSSFKREQWPEANLPEVAFVGRSNVGKSSCLNSLVGGKAIARVSKTPGRTQAINFFGLKRAGMDIRFADLPGYGFAKVPKSVKKTWEKMIGDYLEGRKKLALVVVLVDLRRDPTELDLNMVDWLEHTGRRGLLVVTKADKISKSKRLNRLALITKGLGVEREAAMLFSSVDKIGRAELWARIDEACREELKEAAAEAELL